MKETQMNAEALLNESKNKARSMIEQAELEARQIIEELQQAVKNLEQNHRDIENQRELALQEMKNLSVALIEKVERNTKEPKEFRFDDYVKRVKKLARESEERIKSEKTTVQVESKILEEPIVSVKEEKKEVVETKKKPSGESKESEEVYEIPKTDELKERMMKRQELREVEKKEEPVVKMEEELIKPELKVVTEDPTPVPVQEEVVAVTQEEPVQEKKKGPRIAKTVSFFDELDTEN